MFVFVNFLKRQSPSPQFPSFGHGAIGLPDGRRWNPGYIRNVKEEKRERK